MQPTLQQQHTAPKAPKRKKVFFLSIVAILIITSLTILGLTLFVFKQPTEQTTTTPTKPPLTVAGEPYIYACSAFTRNDLAEVFQIGNKNAFTVNANDAYSFEQHQKRTDLLQLTGQEYYSSNCLYKFNVKDIASRSAKDATILRAYVIQYRDAQTAKTEAAKFKPTESSKALPSFAEHAYFYTATDNDGNAVFGGSAIYGKTELVFEAAPPVIPNENQQLTSVDTMLKRMLNRIKNGKAAEANNFDKAATLGGQSLKDMCAHTDVAVLTNSLKIELRPTDIVSRQNTTGLKGENAFAGLVSSCNYKFRTAEDKANKANAKLEYDTRFGHSLTITRQQFASAAQAQKVFADSQATLRSPTQNGGSRGDVSKAAMGDNALKVKNELDDETAYDYYILAGSNFYHIFITSNSRTIADFSSKGYQPTDEAVRTIFTHINQ